MQSVRSSAERARRLWPFAALALLGLVLVPLPGQPVDTAAWGTAAALTAAVAVAVVAAPWQHLPGWSHVLPALMYLAAVGALRQASGGASGGSGALVLLPVLWMALYGTRGQLAVVIAGVAAVWILPLVTLGAPSYPAAGWRGCVLVVALAAMIGTTAQRLVANVGQLVERLRARDAEREQLLEQLRDLAVTDPLTGLPNRRGWSDGLDRHLHPRDHGRAICLAVLDLDHFKALNDTLGHDAGDRVLVGSARAWEAELRPSDLLARIGGDEFALLLPDCTLTRAHDVLERLRAVTAGGLTCSVGIAQWDGRETADKLQARADALLYQAKRAGRDMIAAPQLRAV